MIDFRIVDDGKSSAVILKMDKIGNPALRKFILGRLGEGIRYRVVKFRLSGQVLKRKTGKLAQSIDHRIAGNRLEIGTNMAYGAIHEFGGLAGRKTKRVTIPKRPYLRPSIEEFFQSGEAARIGEEAVEEFVK